VEYVIFGESVICSVVNDLVSGILLAPAAARVVAVYATCKNQLAKTSNLSSETLAIIPTKHGIGLSFKYTNTDQ
jgi:hypothetical protein